LWFVVQLATGVTRQVIENSQTNYSVSALSNAEATGSNPSLTTKINELQLIVGPP
jgi:hypothetical protein